MRSTPFFVACLALGGMAVAPAANAAEDRSGRSAPAVTATATALSIATNHANVDYGSAVTLSGAVSVGGSGQGVRIERQASGGSWQRVANASTGSSGRWTATYTPSSNARLRARMADDSATSPTLAVGVRPVLKVSGTPSGPVLVGASLDARVLPSGYHGMVTFSVRQDGRTRATARARASGGHVRLKLPAPALGNMRVVADLVGSSGLTANSESFRIRGTVRSLSPGSRGADVAALIRRLKDLRFHTPAVTERYTEQVGDVVLAFRKANHLSRTSSMDESTWKKLVKAQPMTPRHRGPWLHIEVDKSRQILMVVRNGKVVGTLHVSTGATGNTPVGHFRIYQRGGSYLFRFMGFHGNYGIHGYVPVPAYPASHGCVREPMWAADWTWDQVSQGTSVIVYN